MAVICGVGLCRALMMEAINIPEMLVNFYLTHGTTSQKMVIVFACYHENLKMFSCVGFFCQDEIFHHSVAYSILRCIINCGLCRMEKTFLL